MKSTNRRALRIVTLVVVIITLLGANVFAAEWGSWSSWRDTSVASSSTREVETRQAVASYKTEVYICKNSNGEKCYLPRMMSGYTQTSHKTGKCTPLELLTSQALLPGSTYDSGKVVGLEIAYVGTWSNGVPQFVTGETYKTQYRYRDQLKSQKIEVDSTSISKTYGSKAFLLGATAKSVLTYSSSDTNVATVNLLGKVTIIAPGTTTITINAAKSSKYQSASKKVTLTVKLKKPTLTVEGGKKKATLSWTSTPGAKKYVVYHEVKKGSKWVDAGNKETTKLKLTNGSLKKKSQHRYRVKAVVDIKGDTYTIYSAWKSVKIKK